MSVGGLTVRLPRFSPAALSQSNRQRRSNVRSSTSRLAIREHPTRREILQARQMLVWQSLRQ